MSIHEALLYGEERLPEGFASWVIDTAMLSSTTKWTLQTPLWHNTFFMYVAMTTHYLLVNSVQVLGCTH